MRLEDGLWADFGSALLRAEIAGGLHACAAAHCNAAACASESITRIIYRIGIVSSSGLDATQRARVIAAFRAAQAQFKTALGADALCGTGDGGAFKEGLLDLTPMPPPPPLTSKRTRQTPAEKSVAKRVQQAMDLLQTGAMQFADVHGTGASIIFTERDGTFEVEIKRGDDDDATQD